MSEICWISLETLTDYRGNQMEEYLDKQKSMSLERNDKITDEFFFFGFTAGSNILRIKGTVWISLDILSIYPGYKWITVLNIFLNASCVDRLFCFQILSTPVKCAAGVKMAPALPTLKVATFYSFAKENPAPWASVMKAWVTKPLYFSALQSRNLLILSYFCISVFLNYSSADKTVSALQHFGDIIFISMSTLFSVIKGKCMKQVQDVIERLWDFIDKLDINTFGKSALKSVWKCFQIQ